MRTVAIIQARMGSTRLPGKVLRTLQDKTVLAHVTERVRSAQEIDEVVIATTDLPADLAIVNEARRLNAIVVRGSNSDVLSRYYAAAKQSAAELILRVTSDCPMIDARIIDQMVLCFKDIVRAGAQLDYLSNVHPRTFPHGLDAELFSMDALETAFREAREDFEREHVTPFFYLHPERFSLRNFAQPIDQSHLRWTLDEPDDLAFFEAVFSLLPKHAAATTEQLVALLDQRPGLCSINTHVRQKLLRAA